MTPEHNVPSTVDLLLICIGVVSGMAWYWLRRRAKRSDDTMTTQGGGGRGGLKR